MIAGPQIITSFFLATSSRWAATSLAFIGGAAIGVITEVTIAYSVGKGLKSAGGKKHSGTVDHIIDWVVLALLVFLAIHAFLKRHDNQPPKWMRALQKERPTGAFLLGLALLSLFPGDIAGSFAVGLHVARDKAGWWECLPFVGLTLLLLAIPALIVALLGKRANVILPKIRDWLDRNAWIVSEIVVALFAAITIKSLVSG